MSEYMSVQEKEWNCVEAIPDCNTDSSRECVRTDCKIILEITPDCGLDRCDKTDVISNCVNDDTPESGLEGNDRAGVISDSVIVIPGGLERSEGVNAISDCGDEVTTDRLDRSDRSGAILDRVMVNQDTETLDCTLVISVRDGSNCGNLLCDESSSHTMGEVIRDCALRKAIQDCSLPEGNGCGQVEMEMRNVSNSGNLLCEESELSSACEFSNLPVELVIMEVSNLPVELVNPDVSNLPVELVNPDVSNLPVEVVDLDSGFGDKGSTSDVICDKILREGGNKATIKDCEVSCDMGRDKSDRLPKVIQSVEKKTKNSKMMPSKKKTVETRKKTVDKSVKIVKKEKTKPCEEDKENETLGNNDIPEYDRVKFKEGKKMKCAVQSPRKVIVKKETVNTSNESPGLVKTKINTHAKGREQGQSSNFKGKKKTTLEETAVKLNLNKIDSFFKPLKNGEINEEGNLPETVGTAGVSWAGTMNTGTEQNDATFCDDQLEGVRQTGLENHIGFLGIESCDWRGGGTQKNESEVVIGGGVRDGEVLTNGRNDL